MTKKQRRTIERLVQQVIDDHESFCQKWLEERLANPTTINGETMNPLEDTRHNRNRQAAELKADFRIEQLEAALQGIIDWADFAMGRPDQFDSHGVRNLDGPAFDHARAVLGELKPKS